MKIFIKIMVCIILFLNWSTLEAQIGGKAGSFARMGFGARGMSMGNAISAVTTGEINSYYNPALIPFAERRTASVTYSFLSFDRFLNFLSYGQAVQPTAGISFGIINAGVGDIEERNSDGIKTGTISTSENMFFLSFANRIHNSVSIGVSVKMFYHKLYEQVSSTTVGFDIGVLIQAAKNISVGFTLQDINSKYKWDTNPIYGRGRQTEDVFPNLRRISVAYQLPNSLGTVAAEFENSSVKTNHLRFGTEIILHPSFTIRTGVDRWNWSNNYSGLKPTFGYSIQGDFDGWTPSLDYSYVIEPFATNNMHIITLSIKF